MRKPRIALFEDDSTQLELMNEFLEDEGYETLIETDLRRGFAVVMQQQPTLVVLDLIQNGQPLGLDVVRQLKSDPQTRGLPVIVVSADARRLSQLADEFNAEVATVRKPYDLDELLALVRDRTLGDPRMGTQAAKQTVAASFS